MNERENAWKRFASTGRVDDYLDYRRTLENMAEFAQQEDFADEFEHRRSGAQSNQCGRNGYNYNRFNP